MGTGIKLYIMDAGQLTLESFSGLNLLTQAEQEIIDRRKFITAKQEYIASRYIIKKALSISCNCALAEIETCFNSEKSRLEAFYQNKPIKACILIWVTGKDFQSNR